MLSELRFIEPTSHIFSQYLKLFGDNGEIKQVLCADIQLGTAEILDYSTATWETVSFTKVRLMRTAPEKVREAFKNYVKDVEKHSPIRFEY